MPGVYHGLVTKGVQMAVPEDNVDTLPEVAERLRASAQTVRRLARTGEIKTIKVGRQYRVTQVQFDEFMGQPQENPEA